MLAAALAFASPAAPAGLAWADDATPSPSASSSQSASTDGSTQTEITVTDSITDTENLLGGDVAAVTDAINATKRDTGVTVRLMYLPKFMDGVDPEQWAGQALDSTQPDPNTVLLAVATRDGNLVVAVSSNSDDWLRKKATVDKLSEAAVGPILANSSDPDWAGSAEAMMDAIATAQKASVSSRTVTIGVAAVIGALVVVVGIAVTLFVLHRRGKLRPAGRRARKGPRPTGWKPKKRSKGARRRHAAHGSGNAAADDGSATLSTDASDDTQETSR